MLVLDIDYIKATFKNMAETYRPTSLFPDIYLESFVNKTFNNEALAAFPTVKNKGWIHYIHVNEKKHGLSDNFVSKILNTFSKKK